MVRLATELKSAGWEVTVVCMVAPSAYTSILDQAGIPVLSLDMPRGVPDPRGLLRLARLIGQLKPDVLHAHMVHANLLGRIARLIARVPVMISTVHNLRETSERGGPTWHKELLYRITDFLADRTTIIAQSAFERYVRVGAVPRSKLEMIPNGVDTHRFQPSLSLREKTRADLGLGSDFVWLAVGRLVEQKDYPNLLRAVGMLPSTNWQLLVVGEGSLRDYLSAKAAELGVSNKVRFVPAREDIIGFYSAADAFVMSSAFEGMSVALQEAIAMALPCVVTDVGANRDLVCDGITGYVVPPADSSHLAKAMESLMTAPASSREQFGRNARHFAIAHYEFATVAQKWLALYKRCLEGKARKLPIAAHRLALPMFLSRPGKGRNES
ncbi:MAG: glycosyltransferase [Acidobacteriota bacterium]|nr:glycosyltransferase [Acidobacteriota bacterium]